MGICEVFFPFCIDIHFFHYATEKIKNWRDKREEVWNNFKNVLLWLCLYFATAPVVRIWKSISKQRIGHVEASKNLVIYTISRNTLRIDGFDKQWFS